MVKVSGRTIKKQGKVSRGAIWWDYHLEAIAKVSGGTTKWTYYFEVKAKVSDRNIRWDYLFLRYKAVLLDGNTI